MILMIIGNSASNQNFTSTQTSSIAQFCLVPRPQYYASVIRFGSRGAPSESATNFDHGDDAYRCR